MAILYPPDAKAKDAPDGPEQYVLELLRSQLDDSWHVVPNLRIAEHPRHLEGETDVVLLHAKGVIVLEVKG
ncbi:nuclease-related domain-containing protein, partial [Salmonella enterica]|uniref:nuclease-related domain-containing protein n=1 Tax=Salmonella enterica TaxID=28901 RepID=UPI0035259E66